jgi:hypothetical protein
VAPDGSAMDFLQVGVSVFKVDALITVSVDLAQLIDTRRKGTGDANT